MKNVFHIITHFEMGGGQKLWLLIFASQKVSSLNTIY